MKWNDILRKGVYFRFFIGVERFGVGENESEVAE